MTTLTSHDLIPHLNRGRRPTKDRFICPFCDPGGEKRPNLWLGDSGYHCHRCSESGGFGKLAKHLGIPSRAAPIVNSRADLDSELARRLGPKFREVLQHFGITPRIDSRRVGGVLSWDVGPRRRFRVIGNPSADLKSWWDKKSGEPVPRLYGLERCRKGGETYLVGGEMDTWAAWSCGVSAITCTLGEGYHQLDAEDVRAIDDSGIEVLRILYDADSAGERGSMRMAAALSAALQSKTRVELLRWSNYATRGFDMADLCGSMRFDSARVQEALGRLQVVDVAPAPSGGYWWPDEQFRFAPGYALGKKGTYAVKQVKDARPVLELVAPIPLWVDERFVDHDSRIHSVSLCAKVGTRTVRRVVPQATVSAARSIPELASAGFIGLTSENATRVVRYLSAAQAENSGTTPEHETVSRLGWRLDDDGRPSGFVFGPTLMLPDGREVPVRPTDENSALAKLLNTYAARGTLEGEVAALAVLRDHHIPLTLYLASLGSALNAIVDSPAGTWQLAHESSSGKTTALQVASSAWSSPRRQDLHSLNSTLVGVEVLLNTVNSCGLCLDELKAFGRGGNASAELMHFAYTVSGGVGKSRSKRSLQVEDLNRWTCNVILTGEHMITDVGTDTGLQARAVCFWGEPWGERSPRAAAMLKNVMGIVHENHGNVGREFVRVIMASSTSELRERHSTARGKFVAAAPTCAGSEFVDRGAEKFATLSVAGQILERVAPKHLPPGSTEKALLKSWLQLWQGLSTHSYSERSIEVVREFLAQRTDDFERASSTRRKGSLAGRIHRNGDVSILPGELRPFLKESGFDLDTASAHWKEKGLLVLPNDGKGRRAQAKVNGRNVRVYQFLGGVL